jgi:hypothetical protein
MEKKTIGLEEVLNKYGVPDPRIVGKLPKGGQQLDFVGHADTQKALTEIDPTWSMEPVTFDEYGLPAFRVENGMAHMGVWMTLLGVRRLGIGSVQASKPDLYKELLSDGLRNCAMRHNVYLSLWSKSEWDDVDRPVSAPVPAPKAKPAPKAEAGKDDDPLSDKQIEAFNKACVDADLNPMSVYKTADVRFGFAKQKDLHALRVAFKDAKQVKEG